MESDQRGPLDEGRQLARGLRGLACVEAPASLLPAVLADIGLGDAYWRLETPVGPVFVAYNGRGVSLVGRAAGDDAEGVAGAFEDAFRARFGRDIGRVARPPAALGRAVTRWLRGEGRAKPPFDLRGLSEFERATLLKALEIPRGEVRPYGWIAREIGRPGVVRAVGSALGRNPVPLLIPCHRVVRSDGRIGDYAFGEEAKRAVLRAEGVEPAELEGLARGGARYVGSGTTRIYCFPTCGGAGRITDRHRVTFGSAGEARAAGYRPCKVCRPAS